MPKRKASSDDPEWEHTLLKRHRFRQWEHNSPFDVLPNEVLEKIFELAYWDDFRLQISRGALTGCAYEIQEAIPTMHRTIAGVCRRFNEIITKSPCVEQRLSSNMSRNTLIAVSARLRSADATRVAANLWFRKKLDAYRFTNAVSTAREFISRWSSINLVMYCSGAQEEAEMLKELAVGLPLEMSRLTSMRLWFEGDVAALRKSKGTATFFRNWEMPNLRHVLMSGTIPCFRVVPPLVTLDISVSKAPLECPRPLTAIKHILMEAKSLQYLRIHFNFLTVPTEEMDSPPFLHSRIDLPYLSTLVLDVRTSSDKTAELRFYQLLDALHIPALRKSVIRLLCDWAINDEDVIERIIRPLEDSMQLLSLSIRVSDICATLPELPFRTIIRRLRFLQRLEISGCGQVPRRPAFPSLRDDNLLQYRIVQLQTLKIGTMGERDPMNQGCILQAFDGLIRRDFNRLEIDSDVCDESIKEMLTRLGGKDIAWV